MYVGQFNYQGAREGENLNYSVNQLWDVKSPIMADSRLPVGCQCGAGKSCLVVYQLYIFCLYKNNKYK